MITKTQLEQIYPQARIVSVKCSIFKTKHGKPSLGLFDTELGNDVIKQTKSGEWYFLPSDVDIPQELLGTRGKYEVPLDMWYLLDESILNDQTSSTYNKDTAMIKLAHVVEKEDIIPESLLKTKEQPDSIINSDITQYNKQVLIKELLKMYKELVRLQALIDTSFVSIDDKGTITDKSEYIKILKT